MEAADHEESNGREVETHWYVIFRVPNSIANVRNMSEMGLYQFSIEKTIVLTILVVRASKITFIGMLKMPGTNK